jgi:hypothetical protein
MLSKSPFNLADLAAITDLWVLMSTPQCQMVMSEPTPVSYSL